jgi:NAD(P)-dependent dehydrogenase (short-subunit alcohol dehydrogenase family)
MKTVLITGASSGIGRAAGREFLRRGWKVAATMRRPEEDETFADHDNAAVLRLDVTDSESIRSAVSEVLQQFGNIDVLVNNAGYALAGAFEATNLEQVRRQFETNVFGLMETTRAVLPHFRERGKGTIINVSSMGGRVTFPFLSLYHSTKFAVEGFSESLQHELRPLGIRVKIVEPGAIKTDFYGRSMDSGDAPPDAEYAEMQEKAIDAFNEAAQKTGSSPEKVALVIYKAAVSRSYRMRYPAGGFAGPMLFVQRFVPDRLRHFIVRQVLMP